MTEMEWRRFNDLGARLALQDPRLARALSVPPARDRACRGKQAPLALSLTVSLLVSTAAMAVLFALTSLGVGGAVMTGVAVAEIVVCSIGGWLVLRRRPGTGRMFGGRSWPQMGRARRERRRGSRAPSWAGRYPSDPA